MNKAKPLRFGRLFNIAFIAILCAIIVFFVGVVFAFIIVQVPSGSMYPTISLNDKLFVSRDSDLKRGDIAVFINYEVGIVLIKRTIGLPGDLVDIVDGDVYINGEYLEEDYIGFKSYETMSFSVPEDCYLFFGDNRAESADSRYWNNPYIHKSNLIGKAVYRFYPISRVGKIF